MRNYHERERSHGPPGPTSEGVDGKIPAGLAGDSGRAHPAAPSHREKEGEAREETEQTQSAFDLAATEARLSQALSKIHGAGEVTVVLTVANGPRQILAENVDRDGSQGEEKTETVVLSRGSGSQETVTVQEIYPRYQGALLVCAGGDDPTVRLQLTEAMSALTGLGADKISISQGK